MKDPIHPTAPGGFILDVRRLRALINNPKYTDDMEVYVALSSNTEDGSAVSMDNLEFSVVPDEPTDRLVITYAAPDLASYFTP